MRAISEDRTTKRCQGCQEWLPLVSFYKDKRGSLGVRPKCIACVKADAAVFVSNHKEHFIAQKLRTTVQNNSDRRSLKRENNANTASQLTVEAVLEIWERQDGKCALTGVPMTHINGQGRVMTNASIDRIDTERGYEVGNIRLVCTAINYMRNAMDDDELIKWCRAVVAHHST